MEANDSRAASMKDVVRMATLLRDKGDRLLNFSCKFTLTADFLVKLNEAFDLIVENVDTSCFQVINTNNSSIEFLHDLQFLHDFVQKISILRLWNRNKIPTSSVRLEKFRSLKYLDLHRVPVRNIKVSCVRDKLKSLNCTQCHLQDLKDLLSPDEDITPQNVENGCTNFEQYWVYLEEMFLPYNDVQSIGSYLLYLPILKLLDLSHNLLTDISAINLSTGNLEWLNVSYNRLKSIPKFSKCAKLKVLLINDNQLSDVAGLATMQSLQQIDASNNLLRDHSCLESISYLIRIEKLQLQGNPMAFKRGHRLLTIGHLNPSVLHSGKFQLDGYNLSSFEKTHLIESYGTAHTFNCELSGECTNCISPSNDEGSASSDCQNIRSHGHAMQPRSLKVGVTAGTKSIKTRQASIGEEEERLSNECNDDNQEAAAVPGPVHLETKRNIEALRKNIGEEDWLRGGGGQKVINLLGLPAKVAPIALDTMAASSSQPSVLEPSLDQVVQQGEASVDTTCDKAEEAQVEVEDKDSAYEADNEEDNEEGNEEGNEEENDVESLPEQEEKERDDYGVFLVQRGRVGHSLPVEDLLLRVSDRLLIEYSVTNGREVAKRTLSNLVSVSQENVTGDDSSKKAIRLTFRDNYSMEVLSYNMDDEESKDLLNLIKGMLEMKYANSLENAIQLTCVRCSTTFAHSNHSSFKIEMKEGDVEKNLDAAPKCPKCGSAAVVQNIAEEASNFPKTSGVLNLQSDSTLSSKNEASHSSKRKDPIAQWAESNLIEEISSGSEAVDHGLHLHILLNVLPDGQEKAFETQNVLAFQGNSGDAFFGHLVISAENVYLLREVDANETEERRLSGDEHCAPILVEQHPKQNCHAVVKILSGYLLKFGPEAVSTLLVFPHHLKQMEDIMEALHSMLKEKQLLLDEDQRINKNSKLSEIKMVVPTAVITCLTFTCAELECSADDAQYGILVLTSSVMFFVNHTDIETFVSNSEYVPSYERRIADLVSLNGTTVAIHQLQGISLHFSSEEHDDRCMVWPWGNGVLWKFLYALQKPWEDIFSVPFETILAQSAAKEN